MLPVTVQFSRAANTSVEYAVAIRISENLMRPGTTEITIADQSAGYSQSRIVPARIGDVFKLITEARPDENGNRVVDLTWNALKEKNLLSPPPAPPQQAAGKTGLWAALKGCVRG